MATKRVLLWMLTHAAIGATLGEEDSLPTRNQYGVGRVNEKAWEYERKFTRRKKVRVIFRMSWLGAGDSHREMGRPSQKINLRSLYFLTAAAACLISSATIRPAQRMAVAPIRSSPASVNGFGR